MEVSTFNGENTFSSLDIWILELEFHFCSISKKSGVIIRDETKVLFGASLLRETAANWWYFVQQSKLDPHTWSSFKHAIQTKFGTGAVDQQAKELSSQIQQLEQLSSHRPNQIVAEASPKTSPISTDEQGEFEVEKILGHRKMGRRYLFLTLFRGETQNDAKWQPGTNFIDSDGTTTKALLEYVTEHQLPISTAAKNQKEN